MQNRGRKVTVAVFAAVVSVLVAGANAATAAKPSTGSVNATVAPGSKTSGGSFYAFPAQPGDTVTQSVILSNPSKATVTTHIEPVDATTSNATGVSFPTPGTAASAVGRWITVSTPVVTLAPQSQQAVPFTVRVPAGTPDGVHLGGVAVYSPADQTQTTPSTLSGKSASFNFTLQPRRIIAVEVTVPGPKAPKMAVTGARAVATADGVGLVVQMANNGNDYARGTMTIAVPDTKLNQQLKMDTFVPGTSINYPLAWTQNVVPGRHPISVVLKYGGKQLNWNGIVDVSGATAAQIQSQLANGAKGKHSGTFPVALLVAGLVLALLLVAAAIVLRRRRRPQALGVTPADQDQLAA